MRHIEVGVLDQHANPAGVMKFLASLTQRGHKVKSMDDLARLYLDALRVDPKVTTRIAALPHGTIKRFTPITVAIVGASRRFLAQARTHQVGFTFVSASLQYSDYSEGAGFVVPYELFRDKAAQQQFIDSCNASMDTYVTMVKAGYGHDAAGYAAPQSLRNVLVIQGNHESWMHFIKLRGCNRNTTETQYVTMRIWEELLKTEDGAEMFAMAGPDCLHGACREGRMACGKLMNYSAPLPTPHQVIEDKWPLLKVQ